MGILIAYLLGILTAIAPKRYHGAKNHKASEGDLRHPLPNVSIPVICIPPDPSDEEKAEKKKKRRRKTILFWVQIGTLALLFVYNAITFLIWRATSETAQSSSRQLEMIDRPWIKDDVMSAFDMEWQKGSYLGWVVTVGTENVGHSVATGIFPEVKLIAIEGADFIDSPRQQTKKLCDEASAGFEKVKGNPSAWGASVFPGRTLDFPGYNVYLDLSDVDKKSFNGGANLGKSIMPMLIGCVVYHYPSSERAHHTGFVYQLSHTDDPALAQPTTVFFGVGKNIPKDKIILTKVGQFAD